VSDEETVDRWPVKFTGQALEDWRQACPDLPEGDEVVLYMRRAPCSVCGEEIKDLGAMDPEYIDIATGEIVGKQFCMNCMEEGH